MKFVVERQELLRALLLASRVAPRRVTMPILGHAVITADRGQVALTVTDMDRWMTARADIVSMAKKGTTTVDVENLSAFVRRTPEGCQIEAELKDARLVLRAGRARASLPTLPPADFPPVPTETFGQSLKIGSAAIAIALARVAHCISNEETRYYLNGVYCHEQAGKLRLVATDGHRLAVTTMGLDKAAPDDMPGIIVPAKAVADLQAFGAREDEPLTLEISPSRVRVTAKEFEYLTRLVDGTFPDYQRVIPSDNDCGFQAVRQDFAQATARCSVLTNKENRAVKLAVLKGTVQLARKSADDGDIEDEIDVSANRGKPSETGFNSQYMAAALGALEGDTLDVEFTPGGPLLLRDAADRDLQLQVVMAMRV